MKIQSIFVFVSFCLPTTLAATREVSATLRQRGESVLKQVVHILNVLHKVDELEPEDFQRVVQNLVVIGKTFGNQIQLFLDSCAHGRQNQLRIDLT